MIRAAMDERFGTEHRLRKRRDFERVYRHGLMAKTSSLRVFVLPRDDPAQDDRPRLGLSVGTKVGTAIVRNRVKRRVREWFRMHKHRVWGWDVVVQAKPPAANLDDDALSDQLEQLTSALRKRFEERSQAHE